MAQYAAGSHETHEVDFRSLTLDASPSIFALGDDTNNIDDEDGVTFSTAIVIGQIATLDIIASADGILNAWIDFNLDGGWGDAGDQIFSDLFLSTGLNTLNFTTPVTASAGTSYARFRFANESGLSFNGIATSGEVEDYQIMIQAAQVPEPASFALVSLGLAGIGFRQHRNKKAA